MDLRSSFLALALSALAGAAQAQDHKTPAESEKVVLVELFTSQG